MGIFYIAISFVLGLYRDGYGGTYGVFWGSYWIHSTISPQAPVLAHHPKYNELLVARRVNQEQVSGSLVRDLIGILIVLVFGSGNLHAALG